MNETKTRGAIKSAAGKIESYSGEALDDREVRSRGEAMQVEGKAMSAAGSAQQALGQAAERAKATAARVSDQARAAAGKASAQAKDAYGRASDKAQKMADKVDPFVREKPYAAVGVAAVAGLVGGLLVAGASVKAAKSRR
jgi:ElaB/YqjD/DUF883 family membrane-anchored ribosome-binding protein